MNNGKLVVKPGDLLAEDIAGYEGIFFTDASIDEVAIAAWNWFPFHSIRENFMVVYLSDRDDNEAFDYGCRTNLRVRESKPDSEELAKLIKDGFVTKVECFGAGKPLYNIENIIKTLLERGKRVALLPFKKEPRQPV